MKMLDWLFTILTLSIFLLVSLTSSEKVPISVLFNSSTNLFEVYADYDETMDAFGYYYKDYNQSGWNYLEVSMQTEISSLEDHLQYTSAMGFLEGFVSCVEIKSFYRNFYGATFGKSVPEKKILLFLRENYEWMKKMSDSYFRTDDYWYSVKANLNQLTGMLEGYVHGCGNSSPIGESVDNTWSNLKSPNLMHFLLLNAWRDLPSMQSNKSELSQGGSGFIKILADNSDIVFGHTTWSSYEVLGPRIFKHYNFPLMRNGFAEHHYDTYFSSSPGLLSSADDFYILNGYSNLAILQTPNFDYNSSSTSEETNPFSLLTWIRTTVSNQISKAGSHWSEVIQKYGSGKCSSQWIILDLKLFQPGIGPSAGFLRLIEEIPNRVHTEDLTFQLISERYFATYNIPYFEDISVLTGNAEKCFLDPNYCYHSSPRAKLFQKYQSSVESLDGIRWLLSYNSFQNDTESQNDPCKSISCRADLSKDPLRAAYGGLDSKVSSWRESKRSIGYSPALKIRLGPTMDQQPMYCWNSFFAEKYIHFGQPDCFDFEWTSIPPADL